jgi:hypothetical protein
LIELGFLMQVADAESRPEGSAGGVGDTGSAALSPPELLAERHDQSES